ncbi:MAG: hydantoinase B/oxoprolinase family protein, partial [Pseudomonadota bacterium]
RFLEPGLIAIHDDRWFTYPWGVNGGAPGQRAKKILRRADGSETIVGNKREDIPVDAGDELDFITWGGGGWGDPYARDPALVAKEVVQGLVTVQGALAYGVVIDESGAADTAGTDALRTKLRAERGSEIATFNYGPSIEDLRANNDTGLPAPKQPKWVHALAAE